MAIILIQLFPEWSVFCYCSAFEIFKLFACGLTKARPGNGTENKHFEIQSKERRNVSRSGGRWLLPVLHFCFLSFCSAAHSWCLKPGGCVFAVYCVHPDSRAFISTHPGCSEVWLTCGMGGLRFAPKLSNFLTVSCPCLNFNNRVASEYNVAH